jgi:hypothetical protein
VKTATKIFVAGYVISDFHNNWLIAFRDRYVLVK